MTLAIVVLAQWPMPISASFRKGKTAMGAACLIGATCRSASKAPGCAALRIVGLLGLEDT